MIDKLLVMICRSVKQRFIVVSYLLPESDEFTDPPFCSAVVFVVKIRECDVPIRPHYAQHDFCVNY